ncbi:hypothetical protein GCM10027296_35380 [Chitinimonas naiadis]
MLAERTMTPTRCCAACGQRFVPCKKVPNQKFCAAPACQRERKRLWQREKLRSDPDYRENQSRVQASWLSRNPDYWRHYRQAKPAYTAQNRALQRLRNWRRSRIAKMDAFAAQMPFPAGVYVLQRQGGDEIAKMDEWIVHILEIPRTREDTAVIAKIGRDIHLASDC